MDGFALILEALKGIREPHLGSRLQVRPGEHAPDMSRLQLLTLAIPSVQFGDQRLALLIKMRSVWT